jgi:hypothetical protein
MATYYFVGNGTNWSSSTSWASTSGGTSGAGVPTAADDVIFDTNSPGGCTLTTAAACRSADFTGGGSSNYAYTLTHPASITWSIGTSTVNGTLAVSFSSTMTYALGSVTTSAISFVSTSTTQTKITCAGHTLGNVTFSGAGGSWLLVDGFTCGATATVTITAGTLNTNGTTNSWGLFSAQGSTTRSVILGSSSLTMTGTQWLSYTSTNLTFNAGTSTITFSGVSSQMYPGNLTYNNVVFSGSGAAFIGNNGSPTFANLTRTATAVKTDIFGFYGTITVTGTLTLQGNSITNRLLVQSFSSNAASPGIQMTVTAAAVSLSNVDFMDIAAAGASSPWTGASIGNCLGNANITFTTAQTRYGVVAGNFSSTATWSASSGGTGGQSVPLPQDSVILDNNSAAGTYTVDMPRAGASLTCNSFTCTINWSINTVIYGNLALCSGMATMTGSGDLQLSGRSTQTLTSAGNTFSNGELILNAPGSTYTLQDNLTVTGSSGISFNNGTFTANGHNLTTPVVSFYGGTATTINMGTGTWTLTNSGNVWVYSSGIINANTSTILISGGSSATKSFLGGGQTFNNLTISGVVNSVTIGGANTFNAISVPSATVLTMPASSTNTFASFSASGVSNPYLALNGSSGNYVSSPSSTQNQIAGNITVDAYLAPNSWYTQQMLISKSGSGSGTYSYDFYLTATSALIIRVSANGTSYTTFTSAITSFAVKSLHWVRASLTLNNGSSNSVCQFFSSSDGINWTQIGSNVNGVTIASIYASTAVLELGSDLVGTANLLSGSYYEARLYNSALGSTSGTSVFDANFTTKAFGANSFTESSSYAATISLNGAATQAGDGRVAIVSSSPGTQSTLSQAHGIVRGGYMTIQDSKATGGASWYAGNNSTLVSNDTGWILGSGEYNLGTLGVG